MTDRISADPGRIKLTSETDGSSEFYTMEMADNPMEPGTPLQKRTLLSDTTEDLIFGDHQDRTVDEAFEELGGNRVRLTSNATNKLYSVVIDTDHPMINGFESFDSNGTYEFRETKDYVAVFAYSSILVYNPNTKALLRTIDISGSGTSPRALSVSRDHNIIYIYYSTNSGYAGYMLVNLNNGIYKTYSSSGSTPSMIGADNNYVYYIIDNYVYRLTLSDMSTMSYLSSTYAIAYQVGCLDNNTCYLLSKDDGTSTRLIKVNTSNWTISYTSLTGDKPNTYTNSQSNFRGDSCLLYYDNIEKIIYFSNFDYKYSTSHTPNSYDYYYRIYKINVNSGVSTLVKNVGPVLPSETSFGYIQKYHGHIDDSKILCFKTPLISDGSTVIINITDWSIVFDSDPTSSSKSINYEYVRQTKFYIPSSVKYIPLVGATNNGPAFIMRNGSNFSLSMPLYTKYQKYPAMIATIKSAIYMIRYNIIAASFLNSITSTSSTMHYAFLPIDFSDDDFVYQIDYLKPGIT